MAIDEKLLEILACPKCKSGVVLSPGGASVICRQCELKFPVEDNIPIMLVEEAIRADEVKANGS